MHMCIGFILRSRIQAWVRTMHGTTDARFAEVCGLRENASPSESLPARARAEADRCRDLRRAYLHVLRQPHSRCTRAYRKKWLYALESILNCADYCSRSKKSASRLCSRRSLASRRSSGACSGKGVCHVALRPTLRKEKPEKIVSRHIKLLHRYNEAKDAAQVRGASGSSILIQRADGYSKILIGKVRGWTLWCAGRAAHEIRTACDAQRNDDTADP
jgi:hypothetical protein